MGTQLSTDVLKCYRLPSTEDMWEPFQGWAGGGLPTFSALPQWEEGQQNSVSGTAVTWECGSRGLRTSLLLTRCSARAATGPSLQREVIIPIVLDRTRQAPFMRSPTPLSAQLRMDSLSGSIREGSMEEEFSLTWA